MWGVVMARPALPTEVRLRFWAAVRSGLSWADAAAAVGVSSSSGQRWFGEAGGVMPSQRRPALSRPRLTFAQREEIAVLRAAGVSMAETARRVGCHRSTVGRELAQRSTTFNDGHRPRYRASVAQAHADQAARRPKLSKLAASPRLRSVVQDRLDDEHSPEQISARLAVDYPDDVEMRVSHEAIYQALFVQGRGGLRRDLHARLRTGRAVRRTRRGTGQRDGRGRIPGMVSISERPPEADDRAVPGHWEGDLIAGAANKSAIGTLVERATGFVMLLHLPRGHGADEVADAMVTAMSQLPQTLRQTLAWDQGKEMASHARIAAATGLDVYFCDPHSPWQRGTNENTNGLLRQYFPKGADLSVFAPDYLDHVAQKLNRRPRKRLEFRTPAEALDKLLSQPSDPNAVASTA
jgi:transposase, IS30 family